MNKQLLFVVLSYLMTSLSTFSVFADEISVAYEYTQRPQVDFGKATKGALKIGIFSDVRPVSDPCLLAADIAEEPISDIIQDALVQAFLASGATLVTEGKSLPRAGELTEVAALEKDGKYEVTIRTHITLKRGSHTVFDTVIFGRSSAKDLAAAVRTTLDRLVNSLVLDDYFLMEIL